MSEREVMAPRPDDVVWWGEYEIGVGETAEWQIGPLWLAVHRQEQEWQIAHRQIELAEDDPGRVSFSRSGLDLRDAESARLARLAVRATTATLRLAPRLADRPVVTRPFMPFAVPAWETATIYVSSPLWCALYAGSAEQPLCELPLQRPSDTWFGPSTMVGERCYASRTHGRLSLDNMDNLPHRALTQIDIHNDTGHTLDVTRINLPVPTLSLLADAAGELWTEQVRIVNAREQELAEFHIQPTPPAIVVDPVPVAQPRLPARSNTLVRAFAVLKL